MLSCLVWRPSAATVSTNISVQYYFICSFRACSVNSVFVVWTSLSALIQHPLSKIMLLTGRIILISVAHSSAHVLDFFEEEDSVPVRAPPTEAPEVELDEYSGHQTPTEATEEMLIRGQNEPHFFQCLTLVVDWTSVILSIWSTFVVKVLKETHCTARTVS